MTRSFLSDPIEPELLADLLDLARRVPSAGNSQSVDFLVLAGQTETERYWTITLPEQRRATFGFPGLLLAPVLVIVYADPDAYVQRYAEADKGGAGRSGDRSTWPQPFWTIDASFAAMTLQFAAVDRGLGVLFFGVFDHAESVAREFGVPAGREVVGVVALGWPDKSEPPRAGRSEGRPRRALDDLVHWGRW